MSHASVGYHCVFESSQFTLGTRVDHGRTVNAVVTFDLSSYSQEARSSVPLRASAGPPNCAVIASINLELIWK